MMHLLGRPPQSVLCVGAHSDDLEIGCAGTIGRLFDLKPDLDVRWVVLSGAGAREDEARAAAWRVLERARNARVEVADFPDTNFPYAAAGDLKSYFRALASDGSPDLVFTHRREDMHQDHRFVAELTWQHFRNHTILEYEIPKYEGDLGRPNLFVPLTAAQADRKVELLMSSFGSQQTKGWYDEQTFRALLRIRGVECQAPEGFAEAFHAPKLTLL